MERRPSVQELVDDGEYIDIDDDVYGAAMFSVTFDFFEMFSGKDHDGLGIHLNIYRVCFVLFLLLANYVLQLGMLAWVYLYVALPQVHEAQSTYRNYHADLFDVEHGKVVGHFGKRWDEWSQVDELCNLAFSNFWFMYAIICLWWILMLTEVRKTERMWRKFRQLKSTQTADEMIVKLEIDGEVTSLVMKLTTFTRFTLYFALLLPKLIIAVALTVVGTVWLTASTGFSDLILNSVALEFIICIDEILFEGLLPESIKQHIANTKLVIPKPKKTGDDNVDAQIHEKKITQGYHRSTMYCFVIIGGVYLFMTYGQYVPIVGVFPGYLNDAGCPIWWKQHTERVCKPGVECFPIYDHHPEDS